MKTTDVFKVTPKLPYNLQLFADDPKPDDPKDPKDDPKDTPKDDPKDDPKDTPKDDPKDDPQPNIQDLMNDLAKLKRAQEKAASEAAEWKKKYRETLSEKDKFDQDKAEQEAEREEHYKAVERENQIYKIEAAYLGMGYTADEAKRIAVAEADGDFESRTKIMAEVDARKKKEMEAEFIASRPDINAGGGSNDVITKEKFDQMDMIEKSKLRRENPEAYEKFVGV